MISERESRFGTWGEGWLMPTMGFKANEEGPLVIGQVDTYLLAAKLICGLPLVSFLGPE